MLFQLVLSLLQAYLPALGGLWPYDLAQHRYRYIAYTLLAYFAYQHI